jgi:hypothetical protein
VFSFLRRIPWSVYSEVMLQMRRGLLDEQKLFELEQEDFSQLTSYTDSLESSQYLSNLSRYLSKMTSNTKVKQHMQSSPSQHKPHTAIELCQHQHQQQLKDTTHTNQTNRQKDTQPGCNLDN